MTEWATSRRPSTDAGASPSVQLITSHQELERLFPAWEKLHRASATDNPFAHPAWSITWARHFVPADHLRVLPVWDGDRLVALAPLYEAKRIGPVSPRRLRVLATAGPEFVTEIFEVLS